MKFNRNVSLLFNKMILIVTILFLINLTICDPTPNINKYKDDKQVKHSLFRQKNSLDRISRSTQGVPFDK